ncbi:MAG: polysaccharide biosynthesis/export family protein [Phycisphaerae bacterium]|nr:polysaccharide biosynthesis/export family protein [Phycisphaerae bacterium]
MRTQESKRSLISLKRIAFAASAASCLVLSGCETDGFFDPTKVGYFEPTPTTLPVLTRLDVIERETTGWGQLSQPTVDDLQPGELQYRLAAGDDVRVEIFELVSQGQTEMMVRTVDPSGNIRLPTIGELPVAGSTIAQIQKAIETRLKGLIADPLVSVILERGQGFSFVIYGAVAQTGVYGLTRPDFKLMEAMALAGGTFSSTDKIYVIRSQPLEDSLDNPLRGPRGDLNNDSGTKPTTDPGTGPGSGQGGDPGTSIDDLIKQLDGKPATDNPTDQPEKPAGAPGMIAGRVQDGQDTGAKPPIDVDELKSETPQAPSQPKTTESGNGWVWDPQKQEWVRGTPSASPSRSGPARPTDRTTPVNSFATRIIEIDYKALAKGESNFNVIVRPGDQIYVQPPVEGLVVVGGEVNRPGVFDLPVNGQLTLSRLIDVAGGLSQIAIPHRVDLIRRVGPNREAVIRVNLAAIRNRAEPDILIKPDDHIIVGTNFFATPLAVIRNGFRMTYGFGFLMDRNFGSDVFGAPPESIGGQAGN